MPEMRAEWKPRQSHRARDRNGFTAPEARNVLRNAPYDARLRARVDDEGRLLELSWVE